MRQITKTEQSEIVTRNLRYPTHQKEIRQILFDEQFEFCAYTEERISPAFSIDIEHFNPYLKNTPKDSYYNWFLTSSSWNKRKGTKNAKPRWDEYKTVIPPSDSSINSRLTYDEESGSIISTDPNDAEAERTIKYLHLDDQDLSNDRLKYISSLQALIDDLDGDIEKFKTFLSKNKILVKYSKAILTTFKFDPFEIIKNQAG